MPQVPELSDSSMTHSDKLSFENKIKSCAHLIADGRDRAMQIMAIIATRNPSEYSDIVMYLLMTRVKGEMLEKMAAQDMNKLIDFLIEKTCFAKTFRYCLSMILKYYK